VSAITLEPVHNTADQPEPEPSAQLDITDARSWPEFLRIEEAAYVLRVNRSTVDKAIHRGLIPVVPGLTSRSTRVPKAALLRVVGEAAFSGGSPDSD